MTIEEALAWLRGERSMTNHIPQDPFETWQVRIAQADAAMTQIAYSVAMAHWNIGGHNLANDDVWKPPLFCQTSRSDTSQS